ncbi:hypothetical protein [Serratia nevei]|uniref:hypothetical protein n=1 Tax=Serratia nevei TaxID=2703794 RepID=UPI00313B8E42
MAEVSEQSDDFMQTFDHVSRPFCDLYHKILRRDAPLFKLLRRRAEEISVVGAAGD